MLRHKSIIKPCQLVCGGGVSQFLSVSLDDSRNVCVHYEVPVMEHADGYDCSQEWLGPAVR